MPVLFIVLGIAVVVIIAATGHQKHHEHPAQLHAADPATVVELDRGMPPSVVNEVLTALGGETDPARLDALGNSLGQHYPLSASELQAKAMMLRARDGASTAAAPPAASSSALPAPAPEQPPGQPQGSEPSAPAGGPAPRELDAAAVLQAAMRALVDETDPVILDGFAESIRAPYPAAAEILSTRAQVLRASSQGGPSPTPATSSPSPVLPS
jgi:hypothetical protein